MFFLSTQRSAINATPDLPRAERGGPEAKLREFAGNALEDDRVLLTLCLQLCVTSADELIDV